MNTSLEKKLENLSSSCFSQDDSPQVLRTGKRIARDNSFDSLCHGLSRIDTLTPDRLRPHDHSSQDLFGSTTTNKLHHQAAKIPIETDSKQSANNTPIKSFIPKGRLAKLQSATPQPDANPESVVVKTFELTGLAVKDDELSIKQRCKGYHVVSIKADIDNVTGQCTGKAEVQVRTHLTQPELNSFKMKMVLQGLRVNEVQSKFGIKNNKLLANRDFLDPHLKDETGKIKGDCIKSFEKKIANLATSHDLFGGSSGVVKCIETLDSARDLKEIKETQASIRKWDSVRKLGNQKSKLARNNSSGYLKATISSQKKEKVIKG